jgi:hypothetical protein
LCQLCFRPTSELLRGRWGTCVHRWSRTKRRARSTIIVAPMGIKERLENNVVIVVLSTAATAGAAGFAFHAAITPAPTSSSVGSNADWQTVAREKGWVDKSECQALLVTLRILSPGNDSSIPWDGDSLISDLVVSSSQSVPPTASVGFVLNAEGDKNFYVSFPYFTINDPRTLFRGSRYTRLPIKMDKPTHVDMWGILVDDSNKVGPIYSSLDQIKAATTTVLSEKVGITAGPRK